MECQARDSLPSCPLLSCQRSRKGDAVKIAAYLRSIDPLRQGGSLEGAPARHFLRATTGLVRAVPVSCAPCPFRHFVVF